MNVLFLTAGFFMSFFSFAEEGAFLEKKELWEEEKLKVQKSFPQYRKTFNLSALQEKIKKELARQEEEKSEP